MPEPFTGPAQARRTRQGARQHARRPGRTAAMCKVPTGRALYARIARTLATAAILCAAYAIDRSQSAPAAHAPPSLATAAPTLAAATCRRPARPGAGHSYEGSSTIGAPAGPLPSWWTVTLPPWPTRT